MAESRILLAALADTRPRTPLILFCTVQLRTLCAARSLATLYDLWSRSLESCPASGASWSSAMLPSLGKNQVTTTAKLELQTHYYVTKGVSKFRRSQSCKQNYVTVCNLLSQDCITNYLYTRNTTTYKSSIY